jgi:hypothetical protein
MEKTNNINLIYFKKNAHVKLLIFLWVFQKINVKIKKIQYLMTKKISSRNS